MKKIITSTAANSLGTALRRSCYVILLSCLLFISTSAQSTTTSNTDNKTPLALQPGAPAGSYALTGFDNINYYNGNLNFHLPLVQIGGRGQAQTAMMLAIDSKGWHIKHKETYQDNSDCGNANGGPKCVDGGDYYVSNHPEPVLWTPRKPGYGPGVLIGRKGGPGVPVKCGNASYYNVTLTRLTFITSDGTEYELRDQLYAGEPKHTTGGWCSTTTVSRGRVFVSSDGNAATFISDEEIWDSVTAGSGGVSVIYPSGFLMLKDGTRYRIENGNISWMRDRNGNLISFQYDSSNRVTTITDSLNRQVTVGYDVTEAPYGVCDRIIHRGFGGAQRVIRISKTSLANALRQGSILKNYSQLFPELYEGTNNADPWNPPDKVSAVWLPDGRSYKLYYNSYGELARVELPTGGAVEYNYTSGSGCIDDLGANCNDLQASVLEIYRRVVSKKVYKEGGALDSQTTFSNPVTTTATGAVPESVVTVDHLSTSEARMVREKHYYYGDPVESAFQNTAAYPGWKESREFKTEIHDSSSTTANPKLLQTMENTWAQRTPLPIWYAAYTLYHSSDDYPVFDVRVSQIVTTLGDTGQVSKQTFTYDQYNNQTDVYEYDYGDGAAGPFRRRTHTDYLKTNPVGGADYDSVLPSMAGADADVTIHIRNLPTQQWVSSDAAGSQKKAVTTCEYDSYAGANRAALITRPTISGLDTAFASSTKQTRGNVTAVSHRLLQENNRDITTYQQYDVAGNVVKAIDANGNLTQFDFSDRFGAPVDNEAQSNDSPQELTASNKRSYAFATKVTLPTVGTATQVAYTQYDYYLGKPVNVEDANGTVYAGYYNDLLDRPTQMVTAYPNATLRHQTTFSYDDAARTITTTSDRTNFNDNLLKRQLVYDGLGRTIKSLMYEESVNLPQPKFIEVDQEYDALGRVVKKSNPYRPYLNEAILKTETIYDELGRVTRVKSPTETSGVTADVLTTYVGNVVTFRDQSNKDRRSTSDALGRVVEVVEDPGTGGLNYQTTYEYDVLGDLVKVNQGGQERDFTYDSLKRLVQATNPESGTLKYEYDDSGNLVKKIDPRKVSVSPLIYVETTFAYDALNRVVSKSYTDGTPTVNYIYDNQALPAGAPTSTDFNRGASIGRLVAITYGTGALGSYYGYDALGRISQSIQKSDTQYSMKYTYDRADNLLTEQYPSGRVVKAVYDAAGRISTLSGTKDAVTKTYASQFSYASSGAVAKMKLGNGLWEHTLFNTRLQPVEIGLGISAQQSDQLKLSYDYGAAAGNNGNILSQTIFVPAIASVRSQLSLKQTYAYDSLNRVTSAVEVNQANNNSQTWKQTYTYTDENGLGGEYGNLRLNWAQTTTNVRPESASQVPVISSATNRITSAGYSYDTAGNMIAAPDKMLGGPNHDYSYDAENRLVRFDAGTDHTTSYTYDGDGRRVKKAVGAGSLAVVSTYVYDAAGKLVAEYTTNTAGSETGLRYLTADTLGSMRVVTDGSKVVTTQTAANSIVKARYDYLPFGEEITNSIGARNVIPGYTTSDTTRQKFTAKERDNETELNFAQARYYSGKLGRFTSPDPFMGSGRPENPQSWNRYAYTANNPIVRNDPTGFDWIYPVPAEKRGDQAVNVRRPVWVNHAPPGASTAPNVYKSDTSGQYWALNPYGAQAIAFATREGAQAQVDRWHEAEALRPFINEVANQTAPIPKATLYSMIGTTAAGGGIGLVLGSTGALAGSITTLSLEGGTGGLLTPVGGVINVGGLGEMAGATNVNTLANVANAEGIPNLVVGNGANIGSIFSEGSATLLTSSNLPVGAVNWGRLAAGAFNVLARGGQVSMNIWANTPAAAQAAADAFIAAGFRDVTVTQIGNLSYIINAFR